MRAYVFRFPGEYLGGSAVVVAEDVDHAKRALMEKAKGRPRAFREIELVQEFSLERPTVFYLDDGDY